MWWCVGHDMVLYAYLRHAAGGGVLIPTTVATLLSRGITIYMCLWHTLPWLVGWCVGVAWLLYVCLGTPCPGWLGWAVARCWCSCGGAMCSEQSGRALKGLVYR